MAEQALKEAARDFFEDTRAWGVWSDDLFTIAQLADYALYTVRGSEVVTVLNCKVGGSEYVGRNERDYRDAQSSNEGGRIASYFDNALWLLPVPAADELPIRAFVAVKPTMESTGLPAEQWRWLDWFLPGALERLHGTPERPYTNPQKAAEYMSIFNGKKAKARNKVGKGGFARQRVTPHAF
jgi:hypothetical protein